MIQAELGRWEALRISAFCSKLIKEKLHLIHSMNSSKYLVYYSILYTGPLSLVLPDQNCSTKGKMILHRHTDAFSSIKDLSTTPSAASRRTDRRSLFYVSYLWCRFILRLWSWRPLWEETPRPASSPQACAEKRWAQVSPKAIMCIWWKKHLIPYSGNFKNSVFIVKSSGDTILRLYPYLNVQFPVFAICTCWNMLCCSSLIGQTMWALILNLLPLCFCVAAMGVAVVLQYVPLWDCVCWLLGSVSAGCHRRRRGHAAGWWGHP